MEVSGIFPGFFGTKSSHGLGLGEAQLAPRSFRQMLRNSADTLEEVPALLVRLGRDFPSVFGASLGRGGGRFFFSNEIFGFRKGGGG